MEKKDFETEEEYKNYLKVLREDEKRLKAINDKINARRKKEKKKRQDILKHLKAFGAIIALSISTYFATKNLIKDNTVDPNNIEYSEVIDDVMIHSGHGDLDPEGHKITPYRNHLCVAPNDGKTFYADRLEDKLDEQYSANVINETKNCFEELYKIDEENEEVSAIKEKLEEINDSLYKNDDGLWDSDICSMNKSRSK